MSTTTPAFTAQTATAAQARVQAKRWQAVAGLAAQQEQAARQAEVAALGAWLTETAPVEQKSLDWAGDVELKAESWGQRTLTVLASCFGVRDLGGDLVENGAYDAFLQSDASKAVPVYFAHRTADTPPLGVVERWEKHPSGLVAVVKVFGGEANDKLLAAAHGLLEAARKTGRRSASLAASIGYVAKQVAWTNVNNQRTRLLQAIELRELSILGPGQGMCPGAGVLDAKMLGAVQTPAQQAADRQAALDEVGTYLAQLEETDLNRRFQAKQQADQRQARLADRVASGALGAGFTSAYQTVKARLAAATLKYESCMNLGDHAGAAAALAEMRQMQRWMSAAGLHLASQQ